MYVKLDGVLAIVIQLIGAKRLSEFAFKPMNHLVVS
jgi:hypothetical protein